MRPTEIEREQKPRAALEVTSSAFEDGQTIPKRHTGDGTDLSPPLTFGAPPAGAKSFAVLCEDPDAPSGVFVHWLAWDIPASERGLPEGVPASTTEGMRQGKNGFGKLGYGGPKPPPGKPHRYRFRVYALDTRPDLPSGATRAEFDRALSRHVLAEGVLTGKYGR